MGLFNNQIKPRRTGSYWKIKELLNSYKFSLGAVEEYIEADELLGRGDALGDQDSYFSFHCLLVKLENLVPNFKGIEFADYVMLRIRNGNPGLLLKREENEIDFVSDLTLKSMTFIHVLEKLKEFREIPQIEVAEKNEPPKIDYDNREGDDQE